MPTFSRRRFLTTLASLSLFAHLTSVDAFCEEVFPQTWHSLVRVLETASSSGLAFLCPFEISGAGCPTERESFLVDNDRPMQILCADFLGFGGLYDTCTLDCPTTNVEVAPNRSLIMQAMTIRGASDTAVLVGAGASLTTYSGIFENNIQSIGDGGAIRAEEGSILTLDNTVFRGNAAEGSGGAIYSDGTIRTTDSDFFYNEAKRGAAIYAGSSAYLEILGSTFEANIGTEFGPVIFSESFTQFHEQNIACNNTVLSPAFNCAGIDYGSSCSAFAGCPVASSAPTLAPSNVPSTTPMPTYKHSTTPTINPSASGSERPSNRPSTLVSYRPSNMPSTRMPTLPVSNRPSMSPSSAFSQAPSQIPSSKPSFAPTSDPSAFASTSPSTSPSIVPTRKPSMQPTRFPSYSPSKLPSTAPTASPSSVRSNVPSVSPAGWPSDEPSDSPSDVPSDVPSDTPSDMPSDNPSDNPSGVPLNLSNQPSLNRLRHVSERPSSLLPSPKPLSDGPRYASSHVPSARPSGMPSLLPSIVSTAPDFVATGVPTILFTTTSKPSQDQAIPKQPVGPVSLLFRLLDRVRLPWQP